MATATLEDTTAELGWDEARAALADSANSLRESRAGTDPLDLSQRDQVLLNASEPEVSFALLDTLRSHSIDRMEVSADALAAPETAIPAILNAGRDELRERGLPDPDLDLYRDAMSVHQATGQPYHEALSDLRSREPVSMRADLPDVAPLTPIPEPDALLTPAPELDGPVEATQYDVHVLAYPLGVKEFQGLGVGVSIESRDSHGFVVVTERGVDLFNEDRSLDRAQLGEVKLATRGGPDETGWKTWVSPDSSFPDEQSPTESTNAGNVYIADHDKSLDDFGAKGVFHIQTYEVTHDLETMRDLVDSHRRLINREDIDYEVLNRNSNTYTGDVTELLTGETPDFTHVIRDGGWRRLPAFDNDLMDYSKTEFAEEYGYDAPERELPGVEREVPQQYATRTPEHMHSQTYGAEEDYGYEL